MDFSVGFFCIFVCIRAKHGEYSGRYNVFCIKSIPAASKCWRQNIISSIFFLWRESIALWLYIFYFTLAVETVRLLPDVFENMSVRFFKTYSYSTQSSSPDSLWTKMTYRFRFSMAFIILNNSFSKCFMFSSLHYQNFKNRT
jgi:hypothetical protein